MATTSGLDTVIVADSQTSLVNGAEGKLTYAGYSIEDLAQNALFEEVVYLLWNTRLPNKEELATFRKEIAANSALPDGIISMMKALPKDAHPMAVLRTVVSALAHYDPDSEKYGDKEAAHDIAVRLVGQVTTATAAWDRIRKGHEPVAPREDLTLAQNFIYMLKDEEPDQVAADAINVYLVLLAEHGMNASTFTSRVVTATISDPYSAVVAAIGALKGPAHGGANTAAMNMFLGIGEVHEVQDWFDTKVKAGHERIMGIGHRVYKAPDPRASVLKVHAKALSEASGNTKWFDIAQALENAARADDYFIERKLFPNVDYYSAIVLYTLGLDTDTFTPLFAMARIGGWTAHIIEQIGGRLIRPKANYTGPKDLEWVAIEDR